jgi:hypothetical protein
VKKYIVSLVFLCVSLSHAQFLNPMEMLDDHWFSAIQRSGGIGSNKNSATSRSGGLKSKSASRANTDLSLIRFNVGLGPAFSRLTGELSDQHWQQGVAIDMYLVYQPDRINAMRKAMPSKYRGIIQANEEFISRPWFLAFIPTQIMISNWWDDISAWGLTLNAVELMYAMSPIEEFTLKVGFAGPTLTLLNINGEDLAVRNENDRSDWFIGVGISPKAKALMRFSDRFILSFGWTSALYLPGKDARITLDKNGELHEVTNWHIGTFDIQLHYRYGFMR